MFLLYQKRYRGFIQTTRNQLEHNQYSNKWNRLDFALLIILPWIREIIQIIYPSFIQAHGGSPWIWKLSAILISLYWISYKNSLSYSFKSGYIPYIAFVLSNSKFSLGKLEPHWMPWVNLFLTTYLFVHFFFIDKSLILSIKKVFVPDENQTVKNKLISLLSIAAATFICAVWLSFFGSFIAEWLKNADEITKTPPKSDNQQRLEPKIKELDLSVIFGVIFYAPIFEELIFRQNIIKNGRWKVEVVLLSAFIFALVHLDLGKDDITHIIPYIIPGLVFGLGYCVSRNILSVMLAHSMFNFAAAISIISGLI